ncbi:hypothetical protein [Pseudomonas wuhanensis]|uniref:hypothetical protein n=1 Tax=Pseudomonas wuhanensis TaxID=2954098 RepID=UPI003D66D13A
MMTQHTLNQLHHLRLSGMATALEEQWCSGLMKPDTHLGENARQIEVSDDQTTPFLYSEFKREAADLVLKQNYSYIEAFHGV